MSSSKPPTPPRTFLGNVTQAFKSAQQNIDFSKIALKTGAKPALLEVNYQGKVEQFPLLGDRYLLGRSSQSSDIVVGSPIVSQVHASLTRDPNRPGRPFVIKDKKSTNGIYRGKKRLNYWVFQHGDVLTLGPADLADGVTLRYAEPPPWYLQGLKYGLYGFTGITAILGAWIVGLEWPKIPMRPIPDSVQGPVIIYAEEGGDVIPLRPEPTQAHQEKKRIADYSAFLPKAVVASEDTRYYWHLGVDPIGITRALVTNIRGGEIREGGSTITQQLARSVYREYVGTDDSAGRKIREAIVALKLESFYSKDDLLLLYLNRVYLGGNLYGFEDAAQFYFGKSASDLTLSEAATLVGILPAPNAFNPVQNYEAAVDYRDRVLDRMTALGMVSAEDARRARRSRIEISPSAREELQSIRAPYFYTYIFQELEAVLGEGLAREGNFIVEATLDLDMQADAENALTSDVLSNGAGLNYSQGAVVTLDSQSSEIRAYVGGVDYQTSQFDRVSQALRQPGSTFKVFAYAAALEDDISPGQSFGCDGLNWRGQFFEGCRSGGSPLDMYSGLALSENVVALRIAQEVGLDSVVRQAQRMGIESDLNPAPGLVLGESEVTPLELTGAFGAIANEGIWNPPHGIRRVLDSSDCTDPNDANSCRIIYEFGQTGNTNQQVISPDVAQTLTNLMQGVVQGGTGGNAYLGLGEAGKTGTTNDNRDLWFVGFVPSQDLVTGVWLGNDDNTPTDGSSGQAAELWGNYMDEVVR
ncbi:transglycosylase domain-containing protein [Oscillatoria sp. CS-180]|uniref:transglycosylase domain-containing protein n=1 Tax=Oscillatoria sp. CS-180 TaxID=3021720 RepID=UPI00232D4A68|nr:transglycosylase domain-containing protein [Oscillatoria sp. CS-180]MDB9528891.1 transglycosylase domain-containing protein [Oscillatoria sp. CS-180]